MRVIGVDGCKAGWMCVAIEHARAEYWVSRRFEDLLLREPAADLILVDIPIGLLEEGADHRPPDAAARKLLKGKRASSVFTAPVRPILDAPDYDAANELSRRLTGRGLSRQSWAIVPKIREVDEILRDQPAWRGRVREVHPEVCFWAFAAGRSMMHNKKTEQGYEERIELLAARFPPARTLVDEVLTSEGSGVARDDAVDALAAALTGVDGEDLQTVPDNPSRDRLGLVMAMVYSGRDGITHPDVRTAERTKEKRNMTPRPLTPKRSHVTLETRTFSGASGITYLVFRTAGGSFHVFTEVEAKEAARDCGARVEANTREMWKQVWEH
jgi:predicted RNase H-like nuclease